MNLQEKLTLIEEVLDVAEGSLTPETLLAEVDEWDSIEFRRPVKQTAG